MRLRAVIVAAVVAFAGCSKQKQQNLDYFAWLPATATGLVVCGEPVADCEATALGRKFGAAKLAGGTGGAAGALLFQNEYSPALLFPGPGPGWPSAAGVKSYRGRPYDVLKNPLAAKTNTPADSEPWARFVLTGGHTVIGGEAAVMDVIDVAAGAKPAFTKTRTDYRPLLERFGHKPTVEYRFSAEAQEEGRAGAGFGLIFTDLPLQTLLGPVTQYRGRAMQVERDGARCAVTYGIQLGGTIASRTVRTLLYSGLAATTAAGWPLGPEYLSKWKTERDDKLVIVRLDLTKAGCDYLNRP